MTPAARLSAAIEVLDAILLGQAPEMVLTNWGRANRFAGSGDRGAIRDLVEGWVSLGMMGTALNMPTTAYAVVYHIEIFILFAALIALGPLVRQPGGQLQQPPDLRLADFPG